MCTGSSHVKLGERHITVDARPPVNFNAASTRRTSRDLRRCDAEAMLHVLLAVPLGFVAPTQSRVPTRCTQPTCQFEMPKMPKNPFADKRDGASLVRVQLSFRLDAMDRGVSGVLGSLGALADEADASTAEGIEQLAQDTALLMLRRESTWLGCAGSVMHYRDDEDALTAFDRLCVTEAAKFDRENPNRDEFSGLPKDTLAVVSAIACIMGDREDAVGGPDKMLSGDARATKAALQEIAAAGSAEGEIFGFELLWTPDDDSETLEMDEIMTEWPEIMTC